MIYSVTFKRDQNFSRDLIIKSDSEGFIPHVTVKNNSDKSFTFQIVQVIGFLYITDTSTFYKINFSSYMVINTLNLYDFLTYLQPK